jgi:hypothetical protein
MAVVTRYFSTTAGPDADGTASTWAKREPFVVSGAINTLISGFDFTSDSLIVRVGPGEYTLSTTISTFTGSTGPSATFPCIFEGALSDGTRWRHPIWVSAQPPWDANDPSNPMPIITKTGASNVFNNVNIYIYGFRVVSSSALIILQNARAVDWCQFINSRSDSNTLVSTWEFTGSIRNCHLECSGTSYDSIMSYPSSSGFNLRLQGNPSATTGKRYGWSTGNNASYGITNFTVIGNAGGGAVNSASGVLNSYVNALRCTFVNNSVAAIMAGPTGTTFGVARGLMITGGHSNGINYSSSGKVFVDSCRIRDFSSSAVVGSTAFTEPPLFGNITDAGSDADEYVNAAIGDYRIKNTSDYWGKGIGAGDEPAAGGGGGGFYVSQSARMLR